MERQSIDQPGSLCFAHSSNSPSIARSYPPGSATKALLILTSGVPALCGGTDIRGTGRILLSPVRIISSSSSSLDPSPTRSIGSSSLPSPALEGPARGSSSLLLQAKAASAESSRASRASARSRMTSANLRPLVPSGMICVRLEGRGGLRSVRKRAGGVGGRSGGGERRFGRGEVGEGERRSMTDGLDMLRRCSWVDLSGR